MYRRTQQDIGEIGGLAGGRRTMVSRIVCALALGLCYAASVAGPLDLEPDQALKGGTVLSRDGDRLLPELPGRWRLEFLQNTTHLLIYESLENLAGLLVHEIASLLAFTSAADMALGGGASPGAGGVEDPQTFAFVALPKDGGLLAGLPELAHPAFDLVVDQPPFWLPTEPTGAGPAPLQQQAESASWMTRIGLVVLVIAGLLLLYRVILSFRSDARTL